MIIHELNISSIVSPFCWLLSTFLLVITSFLLKNLGLILASFLHVCKLYSSYLQGALGKKGAIGQSGPPVSTFYVNISQYFAHKVMAIFSREGIFHVDRKLKNKRN